MIVRGLRRDGAGGVAMAGLFLVVGATMNLASYADAGPPFTAFEVVGRQRFGFLGEGVAVVTQLERQADAPSEYVVFLEADGERLRMTEVREVAAYVGELASAADALRFLDLLRDLGFPGGQVPGLPHSNPFRGGLRPEYESGLRSLGIDPEPEVAKTVEGFEVTRPVVEWTPAQARGRVIRVRERVSRGGQYAVAELETLADGPEVKSPIAQTR